MKPLLLALAILAPLWVFSQNAAPNPGSQAPVAAATAVTEGYKILSDINTPGLEAKVSQAIREGWEPAGGLAIFHSGATFYQAMRMPTRRNVVLPKQ